MPTLSERFRAMFHAPTTDPDELNRAKRDAERLAAEADHLLRVHTFHRERNHISQRLAAAYLDQEYRR